jgi:hypothetical protein
VSNARLSLVLVVVLIDTSWAPCDCALVVAPTLYPASSWKVSPFEELVTSKEAVMKSATTGRDAKAGEPQRSPTSLRPRDRACPQTAAPAAFPLDVFI